MSYERPVARYRVVDSVTGETVWDGDCMQCAHKIAEEQPHWFVEYNYVGRRQ